MVTNCVSVDGYKIKTTYTYLLENDKSRVLRCPFEQDYVSTDNEVVSIGAVLRRIWLTKS